MELGVFDVLGPIMIGPSSSHTAGAARLARVSAQIANIDFNKVSFGWSESFAGTGIGHGSKKALLAGALGMQEADERLKNAEEIARRQGIESEFYEEELDGMHENSVHITFSGKNGEKREIWGSSVGGAQIIINRIDNFETMITAEAPTLIVNHTDRPGVIGNISRILAENNLNIALLRLSRQSRGSAASAVFELDSPVPQNVCTQINTLPNITELICLNLGF